MNFHRSAGARAAALLLSAAMLFTPALAASNGVVTAESGLHVRQASSADSASLGLLEKGTTVEILSDLGNGWLEISYQAATGFVSSEYVEPTTVTGKVNAGPLNVRSAPSTSGAKVGQMASGTEVEILSSEDGWYQVVGGDLTGYVSAQYVTLDSQSASITYIKVVEGPLNIRSGPGSSYDKVGSLRSGRVVETYGQENGWYKIENGYVSGDYVRIAEASEAAQNDLGSEIAQYALQFVGCKYRYGASGPSSFDCSGLICYIYGWKYGHSASAMMNGVRASGNWKTSIDELSVGDLVFPYANGGHVGVYVGNGEYIHAANPSRGVVKDKIWSFVGGGPY